MNDLDKLRTLMEAHSVVNSRTHHTVSTIKLLDDIESLMGEIIDTIATTQGEPEPEPDVEPEAEDETETTDE